MTNRCSSNVDNDTKKNEKKKVDTLTKVKKVKKQSENVDKKINIKLVPMPKDNVEKIEVPNMKNVEDEVLKNVLGQNEQVRQILTAIYRSFFFKDFKTNILVVGKSGTGKTETVVEIAKLLKLPYTVEDATKFTQEGYNGNDVEEMLYNLVDNAKGDFSLAEQGILIIDEIDKKISNSYFYDVAGTAVIKSLLKIVEGTTVKLYTDALGLTQQDFSTSNLRIVFMGAFEGLDKIRAKRLNQNQIGFGEMTSSKKNLKKASYSKKDFCDYGMPTEFMGRIDGIIEMNDLDEKVLSEILSKSKLSVFKKYEVELEKMGVKLNYDIELFDRIAKKSLLLDTGARELTNTVNYIFEKIIYEVFSNPGKYTLCELYLDIVDDNTKFSLS